MRQLKEISLTPFTSVLKTYENVLIALGLFLELAAMKLHLPVYEKLGGASCRSGEDLGVGNPESGSEVGSDDSGPFKMLQVVRHWRTQAKKTG